MTPDTPPTSVANVVAAGERLRRELLDALRETKPPEQAGIRIELVMFYGQAFRRVRDTVITGGPTGLPAVKVLHECVCGLAIHGLWLLAETPLRTPDESARMTEHWHRITDLVLTDGK